MEYELYADVWFLTKYLSATPSIVPDMQNIDGNHKNFANLAGNSVAATPILLR